MSDDVADQVVAETYSGESLASQIRGSAAQTVGYFAALGAFETPEAKASLERAGLVRHS
mgnify:CR=1 FL=1